MDLRPIIEKKKSGLALSDHELSQFVRGVVEHSIPEFQITALLMAIVLKGLNLEETTRLTYEMAAHGRRLAPSRKIPRIGKHSTGGVGDKTTFLLGPLVSAYGLEVSFMAGRALGHTGGTIDKLSGIPGLKTNLAPSQIHRTLQRAGFCIFTQSKDLAPADRVLYALRDASATVNSLPLIVSSILSKKLAEGLDGLVLDVKYGRGSLLGPLVHARALAKTLFRVANHLGLKTKVMLSPMDQPLGRAVGNTLELQECLEVFRGHGPKDLLKLTLQLAEGMLALGLSQRQRPSRSELSKRLQSSELEDRFWQWVKIQGGKIPKHRNFSIGKPTFTLKAPRSGKIQDVNAREIGEIAMWIGAGRANPDDSIDPSAGLQFEKKTGDQVQKGEPIARIFYRHGPTPKEVQTALAAAIKISK